MHNGFSGVPPVCLRCASGVHALGASPARRVCRRFTFAVLGGMTFGREGTGVMTATATPGRWELENRATSTDHPRWSYKYLIFMGL